jgi:small nuclear ribonucleoprotein (snRNP)-like protein
MKGENNMLEGLLVNTDDFLNLYMKNTMEIVNGERTRLLGSVILRGNNIILITPVE